MGLSLRGRNGTLKYIMALAIVLVVLASKFVDDNMSARAETLEVSPDKFYVSASYLSEQEKYLKGTGAPGEGELFEKLISDAKDIDDDGYFSVYNYDVEKPDNVTPTNIEFTVSYQYYGKYEGASSDEYIPISALLKSDDGRCLGAWDSANEGIIYSLNGDADYSRNIWDSISDEHSIMFENADKFSAINPTNLDQLYVLVTIETIYPHVRKMQGFIALPELQS